jgi:hypothetical protein
MGWVKFNLVIAGVFLLALGLLGVIQMLFLAGAAFTLAYAIHLRTVAVWWVGFVFLMVVDLWSIWVLIVGPRGEFIILDLLGALLSIWAAFWWWKQKSYFSADSSAKT